MKSIFLLLLIMIVLCFGCSTEDAFESQALSFSLDIKMVKGTLVIFGATNLPDGMILFVQVDAAPALGAQVTWAGKTTVYKGNFVFDTIFFDPLPYRVKCILSAALNPEAKDKFTGDKLPFALGPGWEVSALANGTTQLAFEKEKVIGVPVDHQKVLGKGIAELENTAQTLEKEIKKLDEILGNHGKGLARFARLFESKRRKYNLDRATTSFYYPTSILKLQKLDKNISDYFIYGLAILEKDSKEKEKFYNSKEKAEKSLEKVKKEIEKLKSALKGHGEK